METLNKTVLQDSEVFRLIGIEKLDHYIQECKEKADNTEDLNLKYYFTGKQAAAQELVNLLYHV